MNKIISKFGFDKGIIICDILLSKGQNLDIGVLELLNNSLSIYREYLLKLIIDYHQLLRLTDITDNYNSVQENYLILISPTNYINNLIKKIQNKDIIFLNTFYIVHKTTSLKVKNKVSYQDLKNIPHISEKLFLFYGDIFLLNENYIRYIIDVKKFRNYIIINKIYPCHLLIKEIVKNNDIITFELFNLQVIYYKELLEHPDFFKIILEKNIEINYDLSTEFFEKNLDLIKKYPSHIILSKLDLSLLLTIPPPSTYRLSKFQYIQLNHIHPYDIIKFSDNIEINELPSNWMKALVIENKIKKGESIKLNWNNNWYKNVPKTQSIDINTCCICNKSCNTMLSCGDIVHIECTEINICSYCYQNIEYDIVKIE